MKLLNFRFFLLFSLFAATLMVMSCKDDDDPIAEPIALQNTAVSGISPGRVVINEANGVKIHTYLSDDAAAANATHIIESDNSLVIIDAQFLKVYSDAARNYANSLNKPISRLIITHAHPDHFFGHSMSFANVPTYALQNVANIIAAAAPQMIINQKPTFGDQIPDAVLPITNYLTAGQSEVIDGITYQYESVQNAEAEDELIIKLPDLQTMIVGDLIYSDVHLWLGMGQFDNWINALNTKVKNQGDYQIVLAGHGLPNTFDEVDDNIAYLQDAKAKFGTADMNAQAFKDYLLGKYTTTERGAAIIIDLYLDFLFPADPSNDVLEIPVRVVPDENTWWNALTDLNTLLSGEPAIVHSREFKSIVSVAPYDPATGQPYQNVFFGLGQYDSYAAYAALLTKYSSGTPPTELLTYFGTNTNLTPESVLVQPYRNTTALDIKNMVQPGQVLEIAIRDVSAYADFNDFDTKRAAFVDLLSQQDGFLQEFEYRSADGKYYVGMSLYESPEKFYGIASNPAVMQSAEAGALFATYPPMINQFGVPYAQ